MFCCNSLQHHVILSSSLWNDLTSTLARCLRPNGPIKRKYELSIVFSQPRHNRQLRFRKLRVQPAGSLTPPAKSAKNSTMCFTISNCCLRTPAVPAWVSGINLTMTMGTGTSIRYLFISLQQCPCRVDASYSRMKPLSDASCRNSR